MMLPSLSLYVHIPWCVQKCPYCDFNSHGIKSQVVNSDGSSPQMANIPEKEYIRHLMLDLEQDLKFVQNRKIQTIFFGGGTPSIFTSNGIKEILHGIKQRLELSKDCEITLEANPGTVDQDKFYGFYEAGINRLSIGIQSFNEHHLEVLGRIHSKDQAIVAVDNAKKAGFKKVNVDLMHSLPNQTVEQALSDLRQAIDLKPTHLSWYQLTIEPNTLFYSKPPTVPDDDYIWEIETAGKKFLQENGFTQYEVSAFTSSEDQKCKHNLNYWMFNDYLGIGCGAAGKITTLNGIFRTMKVKHPRGYLQGRYLDNINSINSQDLFFEYFLNRFRLYTPILKSEFNLATGLNPLLASQKLQKYIVQGLIEETELAWYLTEKGHTFLNSILIDLIP